MPSLAGARIVVAGAGAIGSATALVLARAGARVTLADPAARAANASGVAAGMLAPAFEAGAEEFAVLMAARDAWPAFAGDLGGAMGLRRSGAVWIDLPGAEPRLEALAAELAARGAGRQRWTRAELDARATGLVAAVREGLYTPEDWRLEAPAALAVLQGAAIEAGARNLDQAVVGFESGQAVLGNGETLPADALVAATGAEIHSLAPEAALLSPIKGHILQYADTRADDDAPSVRTARGYAVPARDGLRIGATMEPGVADKRVDLKAAAPLTELAVELYPGLTRATFAVQAGIRAAAPDPWPLVGASRADGVFLAVGARRNGWLLAPLVAQMTAAYLAGGDPGPYASLFAPSRFAIA